MTAPNARRLSEKIARLLEAEAQTGDLAGLYASIEKINHRLDKLENAQTPAHTAPSQHYSQDKMLAAEAVVDTIFDGRYKEKACQMEPDKPCDHCSMCTTRGF